MLAHAEHLYVLNYHHLVMILVEHRVVNYFCNKKKAKELLFVTLFV